MNDEILPMSLKFGIGCWIVTESLCVFSTMGKKNEIFGQH